MIRYLFGSDFGITPIRKIIKLGTGWEENKPALS